MKAPKLLSPAPSVDAGWSIVGGRGSNNKGRHGNDRKLTPASHPTTPVISQGTYGGGRGGSGSDRCNNSGGRSGGSGSGEGRSGGSNSGYNSGISSGGGRSGGGGQGGTSGGRRSGSGGGGHGSGGPTNNNNNNNSGGQRRKAPRSTSQGTTPHTHTVLSVSFKTMDEVILLEVTGGGILGSTTMTEVERSVIRRSAADFLACRMHYLEPPPSGSKPWHPHDKCAWKSNDRVAQIQQEMSQLWNYKPLEVNNETRWKLRVMEPDAILYWWRYAGCHFECRRTRLP
jgi:hypothetical protein